MAVKQKNGSDCGVAAVANVASVSYHRVRKMVRGSIRGGLHTHEIACLLGEFGDVRKCRIHKNQSPEEFARRRNRGRFIVCLHSGFMGESFHAIACVDGQLIGHYDNDWPIVEALQFWGNP